MHLGEKLGLIKSSNITDLADLDAVFRSALDPEANREEALKGVDTTKYLKVIYLSIMGVNPGLDLTYEQFTHLYHEDIPTTIETYGAFAIGAKQKDDGTWTFNNFAVPGLSIIQSFAVPLNKMIAGKPKN